MQHSLPGRAIVADCQPLSVPVFPISRRERNTQVSIELERCWIGSHAQSGSARLSVQLWSTWRKIRR